MLAGQRSMNWKHRMPSIEARRIGYVLKMFPRLSETFILNEILELERLGVALRIFSLKRPVDSALHPQTKFVRGIVTYLPEGIWREPVRILLANIAAWRRYPTTYCRTLTHLVRRWRTKSFGDSLLRFCQACCLIREMDGVTHLHAHYANIPSKVALLVHRITGMPYSVTTHAKDIFQNAAITSSHVQERLRRARFVVGNSDYASSYIRANIPDQPEVYTIYNGINMNFFARRKREPVERLILSVGRLVEKKGFGDLIDACQLLKQRGINFSCDLVGAGILSKTLKEKIKSLGLGEHVRMLGPLSQYQLLPHYERAMVFALPCVEAADGDRDIIPNVIKEAMAVGVPVVTSRFPAIEELVEHGVTGLLVPPSNTGALAECLEFLLSDTALRQCLVRQAHTVIEERFDCRLNFARLKRLLLKANESQVEPASETVRGQTEICDANRLH